MPEEILPDDKWVNGYRSDIEVEIGMSLRDKKIKHDKRDPGSEVSSSKPNISRSMRGQIPKIPNFLAIRNQQQEASTVSHSEQPTTSSATTTAAAKHPQRSSDRNRRSPSYYGFDSPSPDSMIAAPPKRPRRAGDVQNYQPLPESIVETVQNIADQQPAEFNISPRIGDISPPAPRDPSLLDIDTPTLVQSMTV